MKKQKQIRKKSEAKLSEIKTAPKPNYAGESKRMFVLAFMVKLFPWLGYFAVNSGNLLFLTPILGPINMAHALIMIAFPVWVWALFYMRKVALIKSRPRRLFMYFLCWYLLLTPIMVLLAITISPPTQLIDLMEVLRLR
ncbi:hypothetical protein HYU16_04745 [Candidatus Woesearchaeota archaeon]|nr:hypothetical protein [Candidatus Woesearchaeota archaeon]